MKAAGALCGLPRGLRDNIALIYLLATKRKRLPHERNGSLKCTATGRGCGGKGWAALLTRCWIGSR
jgi:hypothetical protein